MLWGEVGVLTFIPSTCSYTYLMIALFFMVCLALVVRAPLMCLGCIRSPVARILLYRSLWLYPAVFFVHAILAGLICLMRGYGQFS